MRALALRLSEGRARRLAWAAIALYLGGLAIAATVRSQGDFAVYYLAGRRAAAGAPLYPGQDSSRFLYAPIFAIGFVPFAMLPRHAAQFAWFVVNGAALVALIVGSSRMLFGAQRRLSSAYVLIPVLLCARFINNNFEHGQINIPVVAALTWSVAMAAEGRARLSGTLLGAAILIKPFALLGAWYLVLERRWRVLLWTAAACAGLLLLPAIFFGPRHALDHTLDYLRAVSSMGTRYRRMLTNQSATSAAVRLLTGGEGGRGWLSEEVASLLGMGLEGVLLAAVSVWIVWSESSNQRDTRRLALGGLFCLMPSFAPISWKSYYVTLLVPYMELLSALWLERQAQAPPATAGWILMGLSVLLNLVSGDRLNHLALFYSVHFVSSLLALAALVAAAASMPAVRSGDAASLEQAGSLV